MVRRAGLRGRERPDLRKIFESYDLDPNCMPQFKDVFMYAQILYQRQM